MKIFWSWQSDTDGKTGRHFIRQALIEAIEQLQQPNEIEEPHEREVKDNLHLDHDRQGVSGSPDLARTILDKIDLSRVVVADVTPVSEILGVDGAPGKRNMNPNVAIELGYALKALSDRNVLFVLNTYYGGRQFLPFDLAHKAGPILFHLAPDADKQTRTEQAAALRGQFITALRPYLAAAVAEAIPPFIETPSKMVPAIYFATHEILAEFGEPEDRQSFYYPGTEGFYLRLIPTRALHQPLYKAQLLEQLNRASLGTMINRPCGLHRPNKYGAIAIEPRYPTDELDGLTQIFPNGEMWSITKRLLGGDRGLIPAKAFEESYRRSLRQFVTFMSDNLQIAPPYTVEAGAVGLKNKHLAIEVNVVDHPGPIHDDQWKRRLVLRSIDAKAQDTLLLQLFEDFHRLTGYARPSHLDGSPAP